MLCLTKKPVFDQPLNNDITTYDNTQKIATDLGDDYTTGCQLDYTYFKNYYKLIAIDLRKNKKMMLIQKQCRKLILLEI